MKRILDLSGVSTPQLLEIKSILSAGITAHAEDNDPAEAQLCHKSPPKGYPKEKAQYGDPECYRYPLNTKARCLAAWRYVHQKQNKSTLGDKFKTVEGKIKSFAKKNYNLDLQVGESEKFDWELAFVEYYDAETMGERCEFIDLEPEGSEASKNDEVKMEDKEKIEGLEQEVKDLKGANATLTTEKSALEEKASQVEQLTKDLNDQKEELETLRKFKTDTDEAAVKAERIKVIKTKLDAAEIPVDMEKDAEYWLGKTDDDLEKTIADLVEAKKGAQASAEKGKIDVPPVGSEDESDVRKTASDGLKELAAARRGEK